MLFLITLTIVAPCTIILAEHLNWFSLNLSDTIEYVISWAPVIFGLELSLLIIYIVSCRPEIKKSIRFILISIPLLILAPYIILFANHWNLIQLTSSGEFLAIIGIFCLGLHLGLV
jgi:hypothetical protein